VSQGVIRLGIIIAISSVFFIISAIFFSSRGAFLVSGYNMMTEKEKEQYNEKKLLRSMGVFTFSLGILILLAGYLTMNQGKAKEVGIALPFYIVLMTVIEIWYMNTRCKPKNKD
jgi:hypothetical protein